MNPVEIPEVYGISTGQKDNKNTNTSIAGTIFLIIAVLHLARIVFSWEAVIGGWSVPMSLSWGALVLAGYLGYQGIKLSR